MKIGFYQFCPEFGNIDRNLQNVTAALWPVHADLLVLPELAFTGYFFENRAELEHYAQAPEGSEIVNELSKLCYQKNMYIVTGFAEKDGEHLYNSALLIGPKGLVHTYRKMHLFNTEKSCFDPGNTSFSVQTVRDAKIGMMICFDWIFPEVARILALQGADIICHPSNLVLDHCQKAMQTRCVENGLFAITTNRFGTDNRPHGSIKFTGKSQITGPRGELYYQAPSMLESLYLMDIDLTEARNKLLMPTNHILNDRRPDMYGRLCEC